MSEINYLSILLLSARNIQRFFNLFIQLNCCLFCLSNIVRAVDWLKISIFSVVTWKFAKRSSNICSAFLDLSGQKCDKKLSNYLLGSYFCIKYIKLHVHAKMPNSAATSRRHLSISVKNLFLSRCNCLNYCFFEKNTKVCEEIYKIKFSEYRHLSTLQDISTLISHCR